MQIVDHAPTNYNGLKGARLLKRSLRSSVSITDVDLDAQFALPEESYALAFFVGILYHLKNPYFALEKLAKATEYCFISTRIAQLSPDHRTNLADLPVAYLLAPRETNNDDTNYWIFSDAGLHRIRERTGWEILDYTRLGCTRDSDPVYAGADERAFCFIKSRIAR